MFSSKSVVILKEAVKRRPKNLARLSEEKSLREILRSLRSLRMTTEKLVAYNGMVIFNFLFSKNKLGFTFA
jgi:hypothetical protein